MYKIPNECIFRLVHSSSLDAMLAIEKSYAMAVQNLCVQRDEEISQLTSHQLEEMDEMIKGLHVTSTEEVIFPQIHYNKTLIFDRKLIFPLEHKSFGCATFFWASVSKRQMELTASCLAWGSKSGV